MTEHYSGNDPAPGCIWIVLGILIWIVLIALVAVLSWPIAAAGLAVFLVACLAVALRRAPR